MKKELIISDTSLRYLKNLIEIQDAFVSYSTRRRWFVGPSVTSIAEFARIVAAARSDFWISVYKEKPEIRFTTAAVSANGVVTWDDGKEDNL